MKSLVRKAFWSLGYDVRRRSRFLERPADKIIYTDFLDAITNGSPRRAMFLCPVETLVDMRGFTFAPNGWHPFTVAALAARQGGATAMDSILERFFSTFQPRTAAEAVIGFDRYPEFHQEMPPYLSEAGPWEDVTPADLLARVEAFVLLENRKQGAPGLSLAEGGLQFYGPTSARKRAIEVERLSGLIESIKQWGFDYSLGAVSVTPLFHEGELRFIVNDGKHRAAIASALGHARIPVTNTFPILRRDEVDSWPQVAAGLWPRERALAYFDHFFCVRPDEWAAANGLPLPKAIMAKSD